MRAYVIACVHEHECICGLGQRGEWRSWAWRTQLLFESSRYLSMYGWPLIVGSFQALTELCAHDSLTAQLCVLLGAAVLRARLLTACPRGGRDQENARDAEAGALWHGIVWSFGEGVLALELGKLFEKHVSTLSVLKR